MEAQQTAALSILEEQRARNHVDCFLNWAMATLSRNDAKNKINRGAFHRQAFGPHASQVIGFLWIFEILGLYWVVLKWHRSMLQVVLEVVAQYGDLLCYSQPKHQRHNRILLRWMWMLDVQFAALVEMHTRDKEVVLAAVASSCWAVKYVTLAELARKLKQLCSHLFRKNQRTVSWAMVRPTFFLCYCRRCF